MRVFDNFGGDDVRIGKIGAVFEAFVFEPDDIEVNHVAFGQLFVRVAFDGQSFFTRGG